MDYRALHRFARNGVESFAEFRRTSSTDVLPTVPPHLTILSPLR